MNCSSSAGASEGALRAARELREALWGVGAGGQGASRAGVEVLGLTAGRAVRPEGQRGKVEGQLGGTAQEAGAAGGAEAAAGRGEEDATP